MREGQLYGYFSCLNMSCDSGDGQTLFADGTGDREEI
jgi:hypothetical protein